MRTSGHICTFGAVLGVVSGLSLLLPAHYGADLQRAASDAAASRSREVEAVWRAQAYKAFSAAEVTQAALAAAPLSQLSELQQATLKVRLAQVLRYLGNPTMEQYYRLKTEGFHWTLAPSVRTASLLDSIDGHTSAGPPERGAEEFVRLLWEKVHAGGNPCIPRLTGVCLWTVRCGIARTNAPASLLTGPVKNGFTVSYAATDPGFVYTGSNRSDSPLVFEMSLLARANGADGAGPVYFSLVWIDGDQNWALGHLMTDGWLHVKTIF